MMTSYADLRGCSGIIAYESGAKYIKVLFSSGVLYLYSEDSAGPEAIACMKLLAEQGYGLNTFINRYVQKGYALHTQL